MNLRILEKKDWDQVSEIYRQGIETKNATFQLDIPNWVDWDNGHLQTCRFVAELDNVIVGWFALSPVSSRCVYGGVAEVSVYVANDFSGQQIGTKLLEKLIAESEKNGIWTLQAGIFPENKGSLRIHKNLVLEKLDIENE
ncbi:GNAT family N-acetyltransferase [Formosa haliotis]|uniref:GNAT family N-acetyltransferase n=1 Tax=Formosa haliotis TaxID=1555194 RepID=UPI000AC0BCE1